MSIRLPDRRIYWVGTNGKGLYKQHATSNTPMVSIDLEMVRLVPVSSYVTHDTTQKHAIAVK
jgi:hypothetical protein